MDTQQDGSLLPNEQDTMMVYINPEVLQSLADVSAEKQQNLRELEDAAEEGDVDAQYKLALSYCNGTDGAEKDEEKGFYWLSRAADADHLGAQHSLGQCYAKGVGVEKDPKKAVELYSAGAEQGYPPSICDLGLCYELGMGVDMDKLRAAELYREAADQDFAPAQCNLGFFYYRGIGVDEDNDEAFAWFTKAAQQE